MAVTTLSRPLRAAIALSLRADRRATLITFVAFGLRPTLLILIFYLVKLLVDAAAAGNAGAMTLAAVAIAVSSALAVASIPYGIELSTRMVEATARRCGSTSALMAAAGYPRGGGADGVSHFYEFGSEEDAYDRVHALLVGPFEFST